MSLYLVVRHLPFVFALLLKIQLERTANDRENKSALLKSVSVSVKFFGFFALNLSQLLFSMSMSR